MATRVLTEDDIRHFPKDVVRVWGVRGLHAVETGTAESSRGKSGTKRGAIDQRAPTHVVDMCSISNERNPRCVDHVPRLWRERQAQGDMIRHWQHFIEMVQPDHAMASRHMARLTLDAYDMHAECLGTDCQASANVTQTDYQQGLAGEFPLG